MYYAVVYLKVPSVAHFCFCFFLFFSNFSHSWTFQVTLSLFIPLKTWTYLYLFPSWLCASWFSKAGFPVLAITQLSELWAYGHTANVSWKIAQSLSLCILAEADFLVRMKHEVPDLLWVLLDQSPLQGDGKINRAYNYWLEIQMLN